MSFTQYSGAASAAAQKYGLNPVAFVRQIGQESGFNPSAVSRAGAIGIAQFMPDTARGLGVDPTDPYASLDAAARLMRQYLDKYGNYATALAAYNAGPGAVEQYGGVPPYAETQAYVQAIMGTGSPSDNEGEGTPQMTPEEMQAARLALAKQFTPRTRKGVTLDEAQYAAALENTLAQLVPQTDGSINSPNYGTFRPQPAAGGGYTYAATDDKKQIATSGGLPAGTYAGLDGTVYRYGSSVPLTPADIKALYAEEVARAATAAAAGRAPLAKQPGVDTTTGKAYTFDPATGLFTGSGRQVQWPEEDPKLKTQAEKERFDATLEQNRQIAEQQGILTREQIQATRDNTNAQIQASKFATLANLAPQMAQLATDASKRTQDIMANGQDAGFRVFSQRGAADQAPFAQVTPADQINGLMGQVQQIKDYLANLTAQFQPVTTAGTAQAALPTTKPQATAAAKPPVPTAVGVDGQPIELGKYPGGFSGEPGHDQALMQALLKQGADPTLVQELARQALLAAAPPAAGPQVVAALGMHSPEQSAGGAIPTFSSVAPTAGVPYGDPAAEGNASAPETGPVGPMGFSTVMPTSNKVTYSDPNGSGLLTESIPEGTVGYYDPNKRRVITVPINPNKTGAQAYSDFRAGGSW